MLSILDQKTITVEMYISIVRLLFLASKLIIKEIDGEQWDMALEPIPLISLSLSHKPLERLEREITLYAQNVPLIEVILSI